MKTIKMCGVPVHYPYEPYSQQISVAQVVIRSCSRLQNGAVEIPTGCGKTMALLCSALAFQVDQRYKVLEFMNSDDSFWTTTIPGIDDCVIDPSFTQPSAAVATRETTIATSIADPIPTKSSVNAVDTPAPSCQSCECVSLNGDVNGSSSKRGRLGHLSSLVIDDDDDDDDDFMPLARRLVQTRKRARKGNCCSCSAGCSGVAANQTPVSTPMSCAIPLVDIEDTALLAGGEPELQRKNDSSPKSAIETRRMDDEDVDIFAVSDPPSPEVIDLTDDHSSPVESSQESSVCSTQSPSELSTQEFLSQRYFDEEQGDYVEYVDQSVTRNAIRDILGNRTREPVLGGEYGPTRRHIPGPRTPNLKVPKIYYASRTHLQLDQVANEIKKTPYCDARVVILASREHTCINDNEFRFGRWFNRTEMCHELLNKDDSLSADMQNLAVNPNKMSCGFYRNSKHYDTHDNIESLNIGPVIDINSLIRAGRRHKFCPYFVARNLVSTADIVLCPVNYLIDPIIRKSMNINLKGEIIIIDEAHMLEDACRETSSLVVSVKALKESYEDCRSLIVKNNLPISHEKMANLLQALQSWIEFGSKKAFSSGFGREKEFSLPSNELLASLCQFKVTPESLAEFAGGFGEAVHYKSETIADPHLSRYNIINSVMNNKTEALCERLALILNFVFKHPQDYVGSVTLSNKFEAEAQGEQDWSLKLVCQNPALIFETMSTETRSIIFSSATLCPLNAFAAELGITILNTAIKGHVIPPNQTWIGCLAKSKSGKQLYGVYNNTKTDEYMDEVGMIVLDICKRVPYGILVFVTSYWTLEKFVQRWKDTGLWAKIGEHKRPFQESRRAKDFNEELKNFYLTVEEAQDALLSNLVTVGTGCTGPLLMAVMRGKVSEGFNFADNKTRAIVTVGIPYPNVYEDSVRWKREYNKLHVQRQLQDSEGWYNTQAFRALSQSLGRGLRHSKDWCLLLLLESRLHVPKYYQLLPQWMHERMILQHHYSGMMDSIEDYIAKMKITS